MKNKLIKCACGCGKERLRYDNRGRGREYINGHILSIIKPKLGSIPWNKGLKGVIKSHRKGVSLAEEYSVERAEEIRQKISQASKGKERSQETKEKLSKAKKGQKPWHVGLTKETDTRVMKMSQSKKGQNSWLKMKNPDDVKQKISLANKGKILSQETIEKMRESLKGRDVWNRGLTRLTDERVDRLSEKVRNIRLRDGSFIAWSKGLNAKIDQRIAHGEKHGHWLGGISFEPYTLDFSRSFKKLIKERDNHTCQLCSIFEEDHKQLHGFGLSIHHIDYNKRNSFPQNCITLCNRCNILVNKDRELWTNHFQALLVKLYGYEYTEDQKIILDFNKALGGD